ncbi:hypothetical protein HID58_038914, partial [Brassica napus]
KQTKQSINGFELPCDWSWFVKGSVSPGRTDFFVTTYIDLVNRYPLAVLTPNVDESMVQKVLNCEVDEQNAWPLCQTVNIIRLIRFILSGSGSRYITCIWFHLVWQCFLSWAQQLKLGPVTPIHLGIHMAFAKHKILTLTSDIIECLGESFFYNLEDTCPAS